LTARLHCSSSIPLSRDKEEGRGREGKGRREGKDGKRNGRVPVFHHF